MLYYLLILLCFYCSTISSYPQQVQPSKSITVKPQPSQTVQSKTNIQVNPNNINRKVKDNGNEYSDSNTSDLLKKADHKKSAQLNSNKTKNTQPLPPKIEKYKSNSNVNRSLKNEDKRSFHMPQIPLPTNTNFTCQLSSIVKSDFSILMNQNSTIPKGQCVEWVDGRYHQLTGTHAAFNGDAYMWSRLATKKSGWNLSDTPNPKFFNVLVLDRNQFGTGAYGHVAIVENISPDGTTVCTSNWNAPDLGKLSLIDWQLMDGMKFIWFDGSTEN